MDIRMVDSTGAVVAPEAPREDATTTPVVTGEVLLNSIGQIFDFKPSEIGQYKDKLGTIIEFVRTQTDDKSPEGLKWAIRSLQGKIGTPPLGEKWVNYLAQYAYIKMESMKMVKEVEKYEHNNS
jgi:hypothetical protein